MKKVEYYIWFSRLDIKNVYKLKLLRIFKNIENIWNVKVEELIKLKIKKRLIDEILNSNYRINLMEEYEFLKNNKIEIVFLKEKRYPLFLKRIKNPPVFLFVLGNLKNLNKEFIVGMVGSRNCSVYGMRAAKYFSNSLAKQNVCIISGLAKGIDSYAHIGAYNECGSTIAVLGNGLDICYPSENQKLYDEILKNNGTIISEYRLGVKPKKEQFPDRNRIISGISNLLIVVEAKERSGTFITVNYALSQGKDVYAIPRKYK